MEVTLSAVNGTDVMYPLFVCRSDERLTPVHVSVIWGKCEILSLLLRNGGDPTKKDEVHEGYYCTCETPSGLLLCFRSIIVAIADTILC